MARKYMSCISLGKNVCTGSVVKIVFISSQPRPVYQSAVFVLMKEDLLRWRVFILHSDRQHQQGVGFIYLCCRFYMTHDSDKRLQCLETCLQARFRGNHEKTGQHEIRLPCFLNFVPPSSNISLLKSFTIIHRAL